MPFCVLYCWLMWMLQFKCSLSFPFHSVKYTQPTKVSYKQAAYSILEGQSLASLQWLHCCPFFPSSSYTTVLSWGSPKIRQEHQFGGQIFLKRLNKWYMIFFWSSLQYVTCAKDVTYCKEPLMPTPLLEYPWQMIGSDLFKVNGSQYLLIVDYFSRFLVIEWIQPHQLA